MITAYMLTFLGACGGGDEISTTSAGTAEGFWSGSTSNGSSLALVVLENGETWGLYGGDRYAGAFYGQSTGTGNTFTASGSDFNFNFWSVTNGTVKGKVVQKSTINATSSQNVSINLKYESSYEIPASLTAVAGSYAVTGISANGNLVKVPMTITAGGLVTIVGNYCYASGNIAPRASGKNVYNIFMTFKGANCALGDGGTASGIFILDRSKNPNVAVSMALTPSKQDGFIAVGEKTN
jgi:hypothetical protein